MPQGMALPHLSKKVILRTLQGVGFHGVHRMRLQADETLGDWASLVALSRCSQMKVLRSSRGLCSFSDSSYPGSLGTTSSPLEIWTHSPLHAGAKGESSRQVSILLEHLIMLYNDLHGIVSSPAALWRLSRFRLMLRASGWQPD